MRDLTAEEIAVRTLRRQGLPQFLSCVQPGLEEFISSVVVESPERYIQDLEQFMSVLELWLSAQDLRGLSRGDFLWLQTRIAYLIGQLMRLRFDAVWILDEDTESKFFLRYVMGYFKHGVKAGVVLDPMTVASAYLETPPPRSLTALLDSIEELKPAIGR